MHPSTLNKNGSFPDPAEIFAFRPRSLREVRDGCVVVLDTGALLLPYGLGPGGVEAIREVYATLVRGHRLCVPGQVAREFAEGRPARLLELVDRWRGLASGLPALGRAALGLLGRDPRYRRCAELHEAFHRWRGEYEAALEAIRETIEGWYLDDPISELYRGLFADGAVVDAGGVGPAFAAEFGRPAGDAAGRPGGPTARQEANARIWRVILTFAHRGKDVLFVSTDERGGEWVYRRGEHRLFARHELVDEFRKVSGGRTFHVARLGDLLELHDAAPETVREVRAEEARRAIAGLSPGPPAAPPRPGPHATPDPGAWNVVEPHGRAVAPAPETNHNGDGPARHRNGDRDVARFNLDASRDRTPDPIVGYVDRGR